MADRRADGFSIVLLAAATGVVCLPLLRRPFNLPAPLTDLGIHYAFAACDHVSLARFGRFPFRSPYYTGGFPIHAHPEDLSLSPRLLLVLPFGPFVGLKLDFVITTFLAALGTYVLVRGQLGWRPSAGVVSAVVFAFGGTFLMRWVQGWVPVVRMATFPWVLYFLWRARRNVWWLAAAAAVMAVMFLDGKYAVAAFAWFAVLWLALCPDRRRRGPGLDALPVFGLVFIWSGLLAALKLVPMGSILAVHLRFGGQGRPIDWPQVVLWGMVAGAAPAAAAARRLRSASARRAVVLGVLMIAVAAVLVLCPSDDSTPAERRARAHDTWRGLVSHGTCGVDDPERHEDGLLVADIDPNVSPVGWIGIVLAATALLFRPRAVWRIAVLALILLWIDLGSAVPKDLMKSVSRLPGLNLIRKPRAWLNLYLAFCLAVMAGRAVTIPVEWIRRRWARVVPWAIIASALVVAVRVAWPRLDLTVAAPLPPLGPPEAYHIYQEGTHEQEAESVLVYRNVCVLIWPLDLKVPDVRALRRRAFRRNGPPDPAYPGMAWFDAPAAGNRVTRFSMTPLAIRIGVEVATPGRLNINQLKDLNWRTDHGTVSSRAPTLAVDLAETGSYDVRLRYVPVLFYRGLGVSVASLAGGLVVIGLARRRRRKGTAG